MSIKDVMVLVTVMLVTAVINIINVIHNRTAVHCCLVTILAMDVIICEDCYCTYVYDSSQ